MFTGVLVGMLAVAASWTSLPPLPDREGWAGAFAGTSGGALLVAGGANFPGKKPWEGGTKVWYDHVFVLSSSASSWKVVGKLPRPLGYGVSVSHRGGVVCVGGSGPDRHHVDAFRLEWSNGELLKTPLPSLPKPLANACGALVQETLFVAGGQERPDSPRASQEVWKLDLAATEPTWKRVADCPGPGRMLSLAASFQGEFWVVGGVTLVDGVAGKPVRRYLRDAYRYGPELGWRKVEDLPYPVAAAPSPAPTDATGIWILGGDDGTQVGLESGRHRGFLGKRLLFDPRLQRWAEVGTVPAPRVTVPCVLWTEAGGWVVPSGEKRPGWRSPEVWLFKPREND